MQEHYHADDKGFLHKCYHTTKHWLSPLFLAGFLIGNTVTFGPEHMLWEKIWPFYLFTNWMESMHTAPAWFSAVVDVLWIIALVATFVYAVRRHKG